MADLTDTETLRIIVRLESALFAIGEAIKQTHGNEGTLETELSEMYHNLKIILDTLYAIVNYPKSLRNTEL